MNRVEPCPIAMVTTQSLIPLWKVKPEAGCQVTSEMMIECCGVGKRQTSKGRFAGKKCFVSLVRMTLSLVTFSPDSHHPLLFVILSGYTSASEIRDIFGPRLSLSPAGLNLFTNAAAKLRSEILSLVNTQRQNCS